MTYFVILSDEAELELLVRKVVKASSFMVSHFVSVVAKRLLNFVEAQDAFCMLVDVIMLEFDWIPSPLIFAFS
ncbi:hypothetical protein ACFLQ6_06790 [Thermoproteota archaeon]